MAHLPADVVNTVREVNQRPYADQAIFFLNAFWHEGVEGTSIPNEVFVLAQDFAKQDHVKGKEGNELNPIQAFNMLQKRDQTKTALELKALLRTVDVDASGELSLAEYLLFNYSKDPVKFAKNPQGSLDPVKLKELQDKMDALDAELADLKVKEDTAVKAEADAKTAEALSKEQEAKAREAQAVSEAAAAVAKKAEDEVRAIQLEGEAIAAEIKKEEDAKAAEIARLEALSTDQTVGIVKRNMAVQQLAAAKNEDPLPLRKAKLTQDAVVRRLTKATDAAAAETAKADAAAAAAKAAADEATAAREASEVAAAAAAKAVEEVKVALKHCQDSIAAVSDEIEALKKLGDNPMGALFWAQATLEERKRSLPQRMW